MIPTALRETWSRREVVATSPAAPGMFVALAPMDGVTCAVYRGLMTDLAGGRSGISLCVSEFVRVAHAPVPGHVLRRECPELSTGGRTRAGVPVFVQLLGGEPGPMAETAATAAELGAPGIDVNFGCPAKTVNRSDGGATILKTPARIERIVGAMRAVVPSDVPISVKVRIGWADASPMVDIARAAEAAGAAWLTVHGRTRLQLYRPPVDWAAIGRARAAVAIPVVANGDLGTEADLLACAAQSGCTAFMIGRGAMARPLLFRRLRGHAEPDLDLPWLCELLLEYGRRLQEAGAPERAALGRIKQWLRLAAPAFSGVDALFGAVKRLNGLAEATAVIGAAAGRRIESASPRLRPGSPADDPRPRHTFVQP